VAFSSCNPSRRLQDKQFLLQSNTVQLQDRKGFSSILEQSGIRSFEDNINYDELEAIIKQRPNKRFLGLRFYLWVYNLPNPERIAAKRERKADKFAERDSKRAMKGKPPVKTFGEWLMETVGEPPVLLDEQSVARTRDQMQNYLINKGYFNNRVIDSVAIDSTRKRASVFYNLQPGRPYIIGNINLNIPDARIDSIFRANKSKMKFKEGQVFDVSKIEAEQNRITELLLNQGYFYFNKEYVSFDVDSTLKSFKVNIRYIIENPRIRDNNNRDSLVTINHPVNYISKVFINTDFNPSAPNTKYDTLYYGGYGILYQNELAFKEKMLSQVTYLIPGALYEKERVTNTYRRMASLGPFRAVSISLDNVTQTNKIDSLEATINLIQAKKQVFSTEGRGTNKGGDLGVYSTFTYTNRNAFRGAENLEISLRGGVEAQRLFTEQNSEALDIGLLRNNLTFNTIEFGPEIRLTFPRFLLPINQERFARSMRPSTQFIFSLNYQGRPDFERVVNTGSFAYAWNQNAKIRHIVTPLEVSIINIEKSNIFQQRLEELNNPLLTNSYSNHFIVNSRYTNVYNSALVSNERTNFYNRFNIESAGNTLRGLFALSGASLNDQDGYEVAGIQFAHYLKTDSDFRVYRKVNDNFSVVSRIKAGIALPLANLNSIPFDKSYFSGGANFQRGWRARTLGPGSFLDTLGFNISDKIGDVILEANFETRFKMFSFFEGAFFVDIGNIWLLNEDTQRPGAHFEFDRFFREFGIGSGFGIRMDLSFFIIRLDLGIKVHDPRLPEGERWLWETKDNYNAIIADFNNRNLTNVGNYRNPINLNLGIGYPF
jgi:outer membrane protein assembly factor BamA